MVKIKQETYIKTGGVSQDMVDEQGIFLSDALAKVSSANCDLEWYSSHNSYMKLCCSRMRVSLSLPLEIGLCSINCPLNACRKRSSLDLISGRQQIFYSLFSKSTLLRYLLR